MKLGEFHETFLDFRREICGSATGMESRVKSTMKSVDLSETLWIS